LLACRLENLHNLRSIIGGTRRCKPSGFPMYRPIDTDNSQLVR
jgi:hypothetical protein